MKRHKVYDSLDLRTDDTHQLQLPTEGSVKVSLFCCISFKGYPFLMPSFEGNPLTQEHEILSLKTSPWGSPQ